MPKIGWVNSHEIKYIFAGKFCTHPLQLDTLCAKSLLDDIASKLSSSF